MTRVRVLSPVGVATRDTVSVPPLPESLAGRTVGFLDKQEGEFRPSRRRDRLDPGRRYFSQSQLLIVLGPEHAQTIAKDGFSRDDIQRGSRPIQPI